MNPARSSLSARVPGPPSLYLLLGTLAVLLIGFARPLYELARLSFTSELYSHLLLVPLVSAYFVWERRSRLPPAASSPRTAIAFATAAAVVLVIHVWLRVSGASVLRTDALAPLTAAWLLFLVAWAAYFFGAATLRVLAFPVAFLVFLVPMPHLVERTVESVLQQGSAAVAHFLFFVRGTPILREELLFHIPGISLEVAPECSGIRSSLALFITSVVAGQWFLRSPWLRAVLSLAVFPLALVRNGFRVFTIGELCVQQGPHMIDSFIHRHGGPLFFAASLVPFGFLLFLLVRLESRSGRARLS